MYTPTDIYNEIEAFVEVIKFTGRMKAIVKNGGLRYKQNLPDLRADAMELVKRYMNQSLLTGMRATVAGTDGVNTKTGGLLWRAYTTNSAAGDITDRATWEDLIETPCRYGSATLMVACSPSAMLAINRLYQAASPSDSSGRIITKIGVRVTEIIAPYGNTLRCYLDPTLVDTYDNANSVWQGRMIIWNPKDVKWRPLRPVGRYQLPPDGDNTKEIILAEGGWEIKNPKGILYAGGITRPAASA